MGNCFNNLYNELMNENLGLGPMQFTGQGSNVLIKKQKKSAPKKGRFKIKRKKKN